MILNYYFFKYLLLQQYYQFILMSSFIEKEKFMPKVEWECSDNLIKILIKTIKPFYGIIKTKGIFKNQNSSPCIFKGNGQLINKMEIPLLEGDLWQECGVNLEKDSSTLWTQIEINEHLLLNLYDDRIVNITCAGWTEILNKQKKKGNNNDFHLVFHPILDYYNNINNNYIQFGKPYKLMLFGTIKQNKNNWWMIHSCSVSSIDNSVRIELIDSNGCSIDERLISDFQMQTTINPPILKTILNPTSTPIISTTKTFLASAYIPSIFKINSESTTTTGNLLKFECLVEPCNGKDKPCNFPQRDCPTTKNIIKKKIEENDNEEEEEEEAFNKPSENDLELVTKQLLNNNEKLNVEENQQKLEENNTENLNEFISSPTTNEEEQTTKLTPIFNSSTNVFIEKRENQHLIQIIAHIRDNNSKENLLNKTNLNIEELIVTTTTTSNIELLKNKSITPLFVQKGKNSSFSSIENTTNQQNTTLYEQSSSFSNNNNNILSTASYSSSFSNNNICTTTNNNYCISQEQLIQIFWISIFLCFIFIFGCFCNLLVCCFGNRREISSNSGKCKKYEKRGKRICIGGQQKLISAQQLNCPSYPNDTTANKQKKQQQLPESTDLWISSNCVSFNERIGQENVECLEMESNHFGGPISSNTTSIYGALPIHNPQGITPSNRRSSMLSYASVKAPPIHSTLGGRCSNNPNITVPSSRIFNCNQQQNIQQQNNNNNKNIRSISPSSIHSPSTTNTSSSGGNGGRDNNNIDIYQQQQNPPLQTFFHQSPTHQSLQKQQQLSNSLASSSMRSSTLATPSPSEVEEQQTGTSTPRPSMDYGTNQKHQQADTEQHIIYEQNQSSPGVALQNYLTTTIIAGGPEKHESSSFF